MSDQEKIVGRLIVHDVATMNNAQAADVARWLRRVAKTLVRERAQMANTFSATYMTFVEKKP